MIGKSEIKIITPMTRISTIFTWVGSKVAYRQHQTSLKMREWCSINSTTEMGSPKQRHDSCINVGTDLVIHQHAYEENKSLIYRIIENIEWRINVARVKIEEIDVVDSVARPNIHLNAPEPMPCQQPKTGSEHWKCRPSTNRNLSPAKLTPDAVPGHPHG